MGKGLKLLAGGMLAGVVVFLAVIGGQSILSQSKHRTADTASTTTNVQTAANNNQTSNTNVATNGVTANGEKTEGPLPTKTDNKTETATDDNSVTIEDDEEIGGDEPKDEPLKNNDLEQYALVGEIGKLTLLSVNNASPSTGVKGTFIVYDEEGMQVSAVTNVDKTTVELAPGMYEATLATRDQQHSQTIMVKADQTAQIRFESASFEQDTPANKQDDQPPNNTVVTQAGNETPDATKAELANNAKTDDTKPVEQAAPTADDAKLTVSAQLHDPNKDSKRAVNANFYVQLPNGKQVNSQRATNSADFSLPAGTYKLTARYANSNISRDITLTKTQKLSETFTFKLPVTQGKLSVNVVSEDKKSPVKSNIYIQRQDGKHIAKANYSSNGQFMLDPGTYKVTVKAKNMQSSARLLKVAKDKTTEETFSLSTIEAEQAAPKPATSPAKTPKEETTTAASQKPANSTKEEADVPVWEKPNTIPWKKNTAQEDGTVEIAILDGNTPLNGRFVIRDQQGNRIAATRGKRSGEFELKPGKYSIIAVHKRVRRIRYVDVKSGKSYKINFTADQFVPNTQGQNTTRQPPAQQTTQQTSQTEQNVKAGKLKLTAISAEDGSPIPVEFTITTPRGVVLQSVKNIAHFQMTLAPQTVIATMRDGSLKSSQRIEVRDNQEAVFTFSIENAPAQ